ncbi:MAG TPA: metallophosphoesterase [Polyangia bacterium]|nr:metallophosphoesterase [Polyangia bacterium]
MPSPAGPAPLPAPPIPIDKIFRTTGQPDINFVEPEQLGDIRVRLRMMGQGLVVQGPSGVGKTTAVRKALGDLATSPTTTLLSSKKPSNIRRLQEILATSLAEGGHLVIDDFHRLAPDLQGQVADLIKILADENRSDAKVTLIGINPVGVSLVRDFPDLANRFAVISMGKQSVEKIDELIKKGAQAANVRFERHAEFVKEAAGSFFTAQLLCLEAALKEGVTQTAPTLRTLVTGPTGYVIDKVQQSLAFKYHAPLMEFATCDERPPPRGACLALLWLLSQAEDVSVSLEAARYRYPRLAPAFNWLMASNLGRHFEAHPRLHDLFHYNRDAAVLSAEDPQLEFYLRNLRWEAFARDTGHEGVRWDLERGPLFDTSAAPTIVAERAPEPSPAPLPASSVLHLSDLHFGTRADAVQWAGQLSADLRHELGCKHLDVLILSGDVTNRATAEEYQAASEFLLIIKQEFRLSPQQIVMVPGNHDASWTQAQAAYTPMRRADYKGPLEEGQFIDGDKYVEIRDEARYRQRFAPFADFYREVRLEAYPLEYEQQATLHHLPAQKLLILGLNSAWALDHHFRTRASINGVALGQALRLVRTTEAYAECLKLAVWHHPIQGPGEDRIRDTGFIELLAQEGFRLGLHGHVHKADTALFRYDLNPEGRHLDLLCAGTFGAPVREWTSGYPLQYQLLQFEGDKVTVHTRRREEPNGAWKPDARWSQGAGQDPLPRYEIRLF